VEGALSFVQDEGVSATAHNADSLACALGTGNLNHSATAALTLLDEICGSELRLVKGVDIGDRFAAGGFADELYLVALDIFDAKDVEFGEEVEGEFVDCVAEDGFLDEEDVAFCLFDLLDHVEEVCSLFFENFVHLAVVVYYDGVFHLRKLASCWKIGEKAYIWLGRAELELNESYPCLLHSDRSTTVFDYWLC